MSDCSDPEAVPELDGERCASASGVSLHANVAVPARDRKRLERPCRYVARPPVATERLSRMADGRLLYRVKDRWRDGTTHVFFEPGELVEKLAAPVPPPRFHLVRYHGVPGPCASQRGRVVRTPEPPGKSIDAQARPSSAVAGQAATAKNQPGWVRAVNLDRAAGPKPRPGGSRCPVRAA